MSPVWSSVFHDLLPSFSSFPACVIAVTHMVMSGSTQRRVTRSDNPGRRWYTSLGVYTSAKLMPSCIAKITASSTKAWAKTYLDAGRGEHNAAPFLIFGETVSDVQIKNLRVP
jgi:hypothetical protein